MEQQKHYPRELSRDHIHSGRVRVQLLNATGEPLNEKINSSELTNDTLIMYTCILYAVVHVCNTVYSHHLEQMSIYIYIL